MPQKSTFFRKKTSFNIIRNHPESREFLKTLNYFIIPTEKTNSPNIQETQGLSRHFSQIEFEGFCMVNPPLRVKLTKVCKKKEFDGCCRENNAKIKQYTKHYTSTLNPRSFFMAFGRACKKVMSSKIRMISLPTISVCSTTCA
jgi:hypothetical protein